MALTLALPLLPIGCENVSSRGHNRRSSSRTRGSGQGEVVIAAVNTHESTAASHCPVLRRKKLRSLAARRKSSKGSRCDSIGSG